ncbi:AAA family ATPase [Undibacterium pigrum]|uniref:RecF/RecN/SMC family protein n=1 Tax=Undibacterium pigrum TaxID=401470 RepID=A0A318IZA8_9BURK|nr:AAA family ATPase [Undibacterium pigrum]PXX41616.1 RecF/RecN/SMC family protein [Undibacterium pigrum]
MIRAKSISISEFRGIRNLTLDLEGKNFAICGPNGTGKSGIVDALEFALTGNISRLTGTGTGGLSVKEHGPHVDSRNTPAKALVSLTVHIPSLNTDVTIVRSVKDAKTPKITPDTPEIRTVLEYISLHPEITLSRRELIRYVLAEPGKRSKEVQELLKLEEVETVRSLLQKIANAKDREEKSAKGVKNDAETALMRSMGITEISDNAILVAANEKRSGLNLPPLLKLDANTSIKEGTISSENKIPVSKIVKNQAEIDLNAFNEKVKKLQDSVFLSQCVAVSKTVSALSKDEEFLKNASRESFLQSALNFFDEQICPVCDVQWDPQELRQKLTIKLQKFEVASASKKEVERDIRPIIMILDEIQSSATALQRMGPLLNPPIDCAPINRYVEDILQRSTALKNFLPLSETCNALSLENVTSKQLEINLAQLELAISKLPEPTQQDAARDYLIVSQEKLEVYRTASSKLEKAEKSRTKAQFVFDTYARVTTAALETIYKNVEATFSKLYRIVNHDDEDAFQAQLQPSIGKLGFDVDFYGRGYFPPGAYHSEGHQDGMGLCLYLALMDYLAKDSFTFAVLDDVLMSVDSGHRREVSKMLLEQFPNTQFLLTTHDEIWLRHMKTVGLIEPKRYAHFRTWNVDIGPTEWSDRDAWEEISLLLERNDVRAAAALLRHFLEYFAKEVCQVLRAQVEFRGDAQFTLGDLLPNSISKMKKLIKQGKSAAQSWGQNDNVTAISEFEKKFNEVVQASNVEQWQINAAVHFNEWANFQKNDFESVVATYKSLVDAFSCEKCNSVLYSSPEHGEADALRCRCGNHSINLQKKAA